MEQPSPLDALSASGLPVDQLTDAQRAVLAGLSQEEVAALIGIRQRLEEAGPEVVGHLMVGGLFY
jgi:hypothetical protein